MQIYTQSNGWSDKGCGGSLWLKDDESVAVVVESRISSFASYTEGESESILSIEMATRQIGFEC